MHKIDILSQSPNNLIFKKNSNQTFFGGVLSLIFLIIAFLVLISYRVRFYMNNQYEVTSFVSHELVISNSQMLDFIRSDKYNPILKLSFSLVDDRGKPLNDRFILIDSKNKSIERNEIIERRVNDINIFVLYKCLNETNDCEVDEKDIRVHYTMNMKYQGFYVEPQNGTPISQLDGNNFHSTYLDFNPDLKLESAFTWTIIRFEDYKGLLQVFNVFKYKKEPENMKKNDIYIGGKFQRYETQIKDKYSIIEGFNCRYMFRFYLHGIHYTNTFLYEDYKRKERSYLDDYANIFSLWISLYNLFTFVFSTLYSKSFDKYKIIDNILYNQKELLSKNQKKLIKIIMI